MDLLTYLRRRRRRLEALLLVPVVAVALTAALTLQSPDRYVADGSLRMPSPDATYRAARVDAAVAFADAVARQEVVAVAAEQAGVSGAELDDSVTVRTDGDVVVVAARTTRPGSTAAGMVEAVLGAGLGEVFAPALAEAEAALDVASERGLEAEAALDAYEAERGQVGILAEHESLVASLGDLRAQRAIARAEGRAEEAQALTQLIDEGDRRRLELEPLLPEYRRLSAALERADAQITDAQRALDDLRAAEVGALDEAARVVGDVRQESVMNQLTERALAAAAIGLLVAAAALGCLEVLRPIGDGDGVGDGDGGGRAPVRVGSDRPATAAAAQASDDDDADADDGQGGDGRGGPALSSHPGRDGSAGPSSPTIEWSGGRRPSAVLDPSR